MKIDLVRFNELVYKYYIGYNRVRVCLSLLSSSEFHLYIKKKM